MFENFKLYYKDCKTIKLNQAIRTYEHKLFYTRTYSNNSYKKLCTICDSNFPRKRFL